MKKIYLILLLGIFLVGIISATITVTLNSPENNGFSISPINLNSTSETTSDYIKNISLYTNLTGEWKLNETVWINNLSSSYRKIIDDVGLTNDGTKNLKQGLKVTMYINSSVSVKKMNISGINTSYILNGDTFEILDTVYFVDGWANFSYLLRGGQTYYLVGDCGEATCQRYRKDPFVSYPTNLTEASLISSLGDGDQNSTSVLYEISAVVFNNKTYSTYTHSFSKIINSYSLWNVQSCDNTNVCSFSSLNYSVNPITIIENYYNSTAYQLETQYYKVTLNSTQIPSKVYFSYNGSISEASNSGTNWTTSKKLTGTNIGLNTFYWIFTIYGVNYTSSTYTQQVNDIQFGKCNSSLTIPYLNLSFKDEITEEVINATVPTSTFYYWLGDSTNNKTYTYSNTTLNYNYTFCFIPQNKTIYLKPTFQYNNPDYVQRTYEPSILTLTNATTNVTLYLLSTTDGLYVTFQLTNLAGQTISGVDVSGTRLIGSTTTTVASGTTGSDGGITFWLNYHYSHTFTFSKSGYETVIYTLTPTQSSYTVTMGSTTTSTSSYTRGIHELIYPNFDFLDNLTEYDFNYTIDSDYWSLDSFGFNLYYQNGTLIGSDSSTSSTGGTVSVNNINFSTNQTYIYMNYFYEVNNTYINGSRTWIIQSTDGRSFSIWQFFTDFKSYIDSGNFWGFDEFGKILLSVIVLIMVAGSASLRYGVRSDIFVIGIIFGVILILDYGLGWFGTIRIGDNIAVSNLPTIVLAMAMLITIIMEERK